VSIAIVIAVYNGAATLAQTLDSLAVQTRRPDQVIVMDGGSSDGTQALLTQRSDIVTYWRSAADRGIYDAWNKALSHVHSEWVAFLGADDYLASPQVLQHMADAAAAAPAAAPYVYGRVHEVTADGRVLRDHGAPWPQCSKRFVYAMSLPHPGMWHRRAVCFAQGGFDASLRIAGDYALLRPVLLQTAPQFVDLVVAAAREGGISTRPAWRVHSVREAGQVIRRSGQARPLGWWLMLWKNQLRYWLWRVLGERGLQQLLRLRPRRRAAP
jgi:glycosyltransferase involved in cell wall biosynthesis